MYEGKRKRIRMSEWRAHVMKRMQTIWQCCVQCARWMNNTIFCNVYLLVSLVQASQHQPFSISNAFRHKLNFNQFPFHIYKNSNETKHTKKKLTIFSYFTLRKRIPVSCRFRYSQCDVCIVSFMDCIFDSHILSTDPISYGMYCSNKTSSYDAHRLS